MRYADFGGIRMSLVLAALVASSISLVPADDGSYPQGLRPPLDRVLEEAAEDELVPVSVVFVEQVSAVDKSRIVAIDPETRRREILSLLKSTARRSQRDVLAHLRRMESRGRAARLRPLWIGNVIGVDATPALIREIAARPEIAWVNFNPKVDVSLEAEQASISESPGTNPLALGGAGSFETAGGETECGVELMRAPEVWNDLGLTGAGAVVAVIDSGVCWTHSDIENQIWVNPGEDIDGDGVVMDSDDENGIDDDGNGFVDDLIGWNFEVGTNSPDDVNSHGSHVAGSVGGDGTGGTHAGMAPDVRIMVVKVGLTFADEVDVWNAMQYAADNGAHVISMSLGWPHNQNPDRRTWRNNSENAIDAGTAMVVAAGNEGSGNEPDNVRTPGDVPRVITVGAVDCNDAAAGFSSRGPVTWQEVSPFFDYPYPPGLIKPDVSGPGVGTKSHNICNGYSTKSGTSMATPHVAGAVALMISGNPGLTPDEIKQVLQDTSVDLGAAGKDNTYGAGRVDAFAAVDAVFGLTLEDVEVLDSDPSLANGDGGVDTGEIVSLAVTLKNNWDDQSAQSIRATLRTATPGVTLVHDYATWPDAAPLASVRTFEPHFSVQVDEGCNYPIAFEMSLRYNDRESLVRFEVLVGTPFARILIDDDMEADRGWTASGDAVTGQFVRDDPQGILDSSGRAAQPEDDNTPGVGTKAWITGNSSSILGADDVDNGFARLTSASFDATDFTELSLSYARHFYAIPFTVPPSDFFRALWSTDGQNWNQLEELGDSADQWTEVRFALPSAAMTAGLKIRFEAEDQVPSPSDSVVEVLVDDLLLEGQRVECDLFSRPAAAAPNVVGNTLLVSRQRDDLRLEWAVPSEDPSHDAATFYRIWTSASAAGGFENTGMSIEPWFLAWDEALNSDNIFYLVSAENGGGPSGEDP